MSGKTKQEDRTAGELKSLMLDHLQQLVFGETRAVDYDYAEHLLNRLLDRQKDEAYGDGFTKASKGAFASSRAEVVKALEEVKSKQVEIFPCYCQFNKGFAYKKGDPCDGSCVLAPYRERVVSAIDEVERKYRNE